MDHPFFVGYRFKVRTANSDDYWEVTKITDRELVCHPSEANSFSAQSILITSALSYISPDYHEGQSYWMQINDPIDTLLREINP